MPLMIKGIGTSHLGLFDHQPDGSCTGTLWFLAAYMPIVPLRTERIRPTTLSSVYELECEVIEPRERHLPSIAKTLALHYLVLVPALLAPSLGFLFTVVNTDFFEGRAWAFWAAVACIFVLGVSLIFVVEALQRRATFPNGADPSGS